MFEKNVLGCVGHGFVGEALEKGMRHAFTVLVHDPYKYPKDKIGSGAVGLNLVNTLDELTRRAEVIFVCVPTPMNPDGSASTKIVESAVASIAEFGRMNVVVIKSTVPPGTTEGLHLRWATTAYKQRNLKGVVFNPEFLTEANYIEDFKNQTRIILGGRSDEAKTIVKRVYQKAYPKVPTIKTHPTIAEMVKYTTNTFLATKVAFANEIQQVCVGLGVDYDKVIEYARYDERLGNTHWAVPGPDGHLGFGLSCLPKDLNALISRCNELGVKPTVMSAVWEKNLEVRPEAARDWERMAKAVTNPKQDPSKPIK